ncbi:MAG: IPT/TIG domain-containing protein [Solirubrobacteraceae bacterium]
MTDAGVNFVAEPAEVKNVAIGTYRLDVGSPAGVSISAAVEATAAATEQRMQLARAVAQDHKEEKKQRGVVDLVERSSDRADGVTNRVQEADALWQEVATGKLDVGTVNGQIDSLLALLQKLDREGRFDEQLRLARALSRLLAVALRWLDLLRSLRTTLAAAERHGDSSARAWALHELGTLHLACNDLRAADRELSQAVELRKELADTRGLAATERNLQVLCRTLRQMMREGRMAERRGLRRLLHAPFAVIALFVLVFAAATAAIAASGVFSGGSAPAAVVPTLAQIVPGSGPSAGGTVVTITGTQLSHAHSVRFGHTTATNLTQISATQLRVTTPPGSGTVPVTVVTSQGTSASSASAHFTYTAPGAPAVSGVAPNSGPAAGGTIVTITGTKLADATAVRFGHARGAGLKPISATQLQVTTPPGSGTVPVTVVTPHRESAPGSTAQFQYVLTRVTRVVTQIVPDSGSTAGGTRVTITGTGLANASAIRFGSTTGTELHVLSDTRVEVTTPPGAGTVPVTVVTTQGDSEPSSQARFTYTTTPAAPTIGAVAPMTGPTAGGTIVTITGTGLGHANAVTFGGRSGTGLRQVSDTQLQVTTPAGSGTVPVAISTAAGSSMPSAMGQFTYVADTAAPTITGIDLDSGPAAGGMIVTITGTGLANPKTVIFGSTDGTALHSISAMQLQVTTPAGSGTVPVTVFTAAGKSASSRAARFTYTSQPPRIRSILPDKSGPGSSVTITGIGLATATAVSFAASSGMGVTPNSDNSLTVTVPPLPASSPCDARVDVTVTAGGATSAPHAFFYVCG